MLRPVARVVHFLCRKGTRFFVFKCLGNGTLHYLCSSTLLLKELAGCFVFTVTLWRWHGSFLYFIELGTRQFFSIATSDNATTRQSKKKVSTPNLAVICWFQQKCLIVATVVACAQLWYIYFQTDYVQFKFCFFHFCSSFNYIFVISFDCYIFLACLGHLSTFLRFRIKKGSKL